MQNNNNEKCKDSLYIGVLFTLYLSFRNITGLRKARRMFRHENRKYNTQYLKIKKNKIKYSICILAIIQILEMYFKLTKSCVYYYRFSSIFLLYSFFVLCSLDSIESSINKMTAKTRFTNFVILSCMSLFSFSFKAL